VFERVPLLMVTRLNVVPPTPVPLKLSSLVPEKVILQSPVPFRKLMVPVVDYRPGGLKSGGCLLH